MAPGLCLFHLFVLLMHMLFDSTLLSFVQCFIQALLLMHGQMLCQVCLLREALEAAGLRADKGTFACMHAKMIEEVVPFAEEHAALLVVAFENLDLTHRSWVLVLEHSEISRAWHSLVDFNRAKIVVLTIAHMNLGIIGHLLCHLVIG